MHDRRPNFDALTGRYDEGVEWALSELEKAIEGASSESQAREALEFVRRAFSNVRTSASTDPLTGLANRAWFYQVLEERLTPGRGISASAAVLFLDLDGFKEVNDLRGHQAGDALLAEVAGRISHTVRDQDLVARHGGDEFVVLLERIETPAVAHAVAARIIDAIGSPFRVDEDEFNLGVSIGVAFFPEHGATAQELLKRADHAMYRAKFQGGRSYAVFGEREDLVVPRSPRRSWAWELAPSMDIVAAPEVQIRVLERKR
jgi:diguanylate cyclase (GGDEF)-like protein